MIKLSQKLSVSIAMDRDRVVMKYGDLIAIVAIDGSIKYCNSKDDILIEKLQIDYRVNNVNLLKARNYQHVYGDLYRVEFYFKAGDNEYIYGMDQYAIGYLNLKEVCS